jgi:hypothetical protein
VQDLEGKIDAMVSGYVHSFDWVVLCERRIFRMINRFSILFDEK